MQRAVWSPARAGSTLVMLALIAACESEEPTLEEQVDDPTQRTKAACDPLPASSYRVSDEFAADLAIEVIDCGFAFPSRLRFSPDGELLLVASLRGVVELYVRDGERLQLAESTLHDLGDLGVEDEAGLTSVFFGADFDLDSEEIARRDVFSSYQKRVDGRFRNIVRRVTLERADGGIIATDPVDIVTFSGDASQAHQIQDGVGLMVEGEPHILVAIGDGLDWRDARDPSNPNGTLQLLRRDGREPIGPAPWPEAPSTRAIGLRNAYGFVRLPAEVDARRAIVAFENGSSENDRAWLVRPFPSSGVPEQLDLGWRGSDSDSSWLGFRDPHSRSALGEARRAVFMTWSPPISPTSVAVHPGSDVIPETRRGQASVVVATFGKSGDSSLGPGKTIELVTVTNLEGAAIDADRTTVVERAPSGDGEFRHPVALDVDPRTGDIYFADIISGELSRVRSVN